MEVFALDGERVVHARPAMKNHQACRPVSPVSVLPDAHEPAPRSALVLVAMTVLPLASVLPLGAWGADLQAFAVDQIELARAALQSFYAVVTDPAAWLRSAGVESGYAQRPW